MTSDHPPKPALPIRRNRSLRVNPARSPGWICGSERAPRPGERVHTHEGTGVVIRLLTKTADGGRVLEVSMDDGRKQPFFAATDNVRVPPPEADRPGTEEEEAENP